MATKWVVVLALAFMVGNFVKGKNVTKFLMVTILLTFLIKKGLFWGKFRMYSKLFFDHNICFTEYANSQIILKICLSFLSLTE